MGFAEFADIENCFRLNTKWDNVHDEELKTALAQNDESWGGVALFAL